MYYIFILFHITVWITKFLQVCGNIVLLIDIECMTYIIKQNIVLHSRIKAVKATVLNTQGMTLLHKFQ